MKHLLLSLAVLLWASSVHAGVSYVEDSKNAMIYFIQVSDGDVNALYCDNIDRDTARKIAHQVSTDQEAYDKSKCKLMTSGITIETMNKFAPIVKQTMLEMYDLQNGPRTDLLPGVNPNSGTDDILHRNAERIKERHDARALFMKKLERIDGPGMLRDFIYIAKSPLVTLVSAKTLETELNQVMQMEELNQQ